MPTTTQNKIKSDGSTAEYYILPKKVKHIEDLVRHKRMNKHISHIFLLCFSYREKNYITDWPIRIEAKELQDLISYRNMNAQIGEVFRSCYRYGEVEHSEQLRDAKKIAFYLAEEIKRIKLYCKENIKNDILLAKLDIMVGHAREEIKRLSR